MADLAPFPDLAVSLLDALAEFGDTGSVTPADLKDRLPFHRIRRVPGGGGSLITDSQRIEILTFAATYAEAMPLARQIEQRMTSSVGAVPKLDRATSEGPAEVPYPDPTVRCIRHAYVLRARR